ncbi:hypothetical protein EVAR_33870_1 [Eumeta japonica]|uniref:Uncharacterized protein n=1 Tax=Eumeta variegata TaxID=151549 RepID=A0A4C1X5S6_EUMVA|nr:hypothetical protein EVAR_33870_1 [Eumeta japonica]
MRCDSTSRYHLKIDPPAAPRPAPAGPPYESFYMTSLNYWGRMYTGSFNSAFIGRRVNMAVRGLVAVQIRAVICGGAVSRPGLPFNVFCVHQSKEERLVCPDSSLRHV